VPAADVEDAAQEVFLTLHRRLPTLEVGRSLRPWLLAVAARVAVGSRRLAHRRHEIPDDALDAPADEGKRADELLEAHEARRLVRQLVGALDDDKRAVLVLHDLEELPAVAIAARLAVPLNTVYSRLRLARGAVARACKRHALWEVEGSATPYKACA
jgi:RNA polymerase sigma-70 factor (ECF subfamily)